MRATYTHEDRLVVGGAIPGTGQLDLPAYTEVLGTETHLAGRELGIINVGGAGHVLVDGDKHELEHLDGLALVLDLLGDDVDAVAAGQGGEVLGGQVGEGAEDRALAALDDLVLQGLGADLEEADVAAGQFLEVHVQPSDLVEAEAEAQFGQPTHVADRR